MHVYIHASATKGAGRSQLEQKVNPGFRFDWLVLNIINITVTKFHS